MALRWSATGVGAINGCWVGFVVGLNGFLHGSHL